MEFVVTRRAARVTQLIALGAERMPTFLFTKSIRQVVHAPTPLSFQFGFDNLKAKTYARHICLPITLRSVFRRIRGTETGKAQALMMMEKNCAQWQPRKWKYDGTCITRWLKYYTRPACMYVDETNNQLRVYAEFSCVFHATITLRDLINGSMLI